MNPPSSKVSSVCSRTSQRSSYSSLSSFVDESPKKKKKTDRMIYSIDKQEFQWSQNNPRAKSINREKKAKEHANFEDYLSDSLSDDSESFDTFLNKSLKRAKEFNQKRAIKQEPFKKGYVPNWRDNFYTSLLDWNHQNIIFAACDYEIYQFTLDSFDTKDSRVYVWPWIKGAKINAIKCSPTQPHSAVAYDNGSLQVYDYNKKRALNLDIVHSSRITALDWTQQTILTGSKDHTLKMFDERTFKESIYLASVHNQEVLGVKRSGNLIASGGNDNIVAIYDIRMTDNLLYTYEHEAAVKSLAWAKNDELLISGGGTSDKMLKFWNHKEMDVTKQIETGSQVCNLVVSKNTNEFVSCQGFSQNQVVLWDLDGKKVQILHGKHSARVLYSCLSPCGEYLATGAGDTRLLIWKMFPQQERKNRLMEKTDLR